MTAFGPLVVLFGQHRAAQADDGVAVGKCPHDVSAPVNLLIQSFIGFVGQVLAPDFLG